MAAGGGGLSGTAILAELEADAAGAAIEYKSDDLRYDLGLLAAFDAHPLDPEAYAADREAALLRATQENTQLLFKRIFELPVERTELGPVAVLPSVETRLPRAKPVPKPKPMTRWEKFALAKGIKKKEKRSRMVYDEASGEYAPRTGYKRARDAAATWAYELKAGDDPSVDHIARLEAEKKLRVGKNKLNALGNMERAAKEDEARTGGAGGKELFSAPAAGGKERRDKKGREDAPAGGSKRIRFADESDSGKPVPVGIPAQLKIAEGKVDGVTGHGKQARPKPAGEARSTKAERLALASVSTASMGRFDKSVSGEPPRPKDPRKQKRLPTDTPITVEKERDSSVLKRVLGASGGEGEAAAAGGMRVGGSSARPPNGADGASGGGRPAGGKFGGGKFAGGKSADGKSKFGGAGGGSKFGGAGGGSKFGGAGGGSKFGGSGGGPKGGAGVGKGGKSFKGGKGGAGGGKGKR